MLNMRLGEYLIQKNLITEEILSKALKIQETQPKKLLGEILIQEKLISEKALFNSLLEHESKPKLGEILIFIGLITRENLDSALKIQKEHPHKQIGNILVEEKFITQPILTRYLALQNEYQNNNFKDFLDSLEPALIESNM